MTALCDGYPDPDTAYDLHCEDIAISLQRNNGGGKPEPCPSCDGDGEILPNPMKPPVLCAECGGSGRSKYRRPG